MKTARNISYVSSDVKIDLIATTLFRYNIKLMLKLIFNIRYSPLILPLNIRFKQAVALTVSRSVSKNLGGAMKAQSNLK